MKKVLLFLSVVLAVFSLFVSCDGSPDVVRYHVTVRNGGEVYRERDVADGDVYVLPVKPKGDTRAFKGWLVGGKILEPGEEVTITADTEITAVWTEICTVSFDLGDETLEKIESLTVENGGTVKKPAVPSRTGYTFSSWKLNGNDFSFDTPITESITLTAGWTINTYKVRFDLCDDSLANIADETVDYGSHATEPPSSTIPSRTGYAFGGWYLNEEEYEFDTAVVTEDITLKAHWIADTCTVTFDTNGGEDMASVQIPYGEKMNFVSQPVPARTGYTFSGWKLNGNDFAFDTPITESITLVAGWSINKYTVSFNEGYGTYKAVSQQSVEYGSKAQAVTEPKRTGYLFSGWKIEGAGMFDFENPITSNTVIIAEWTQITTSLTLYFPKSVNFIDTVVVSVGTSSLEFSYSGGTADGDYLKYTGTVTGLDYGTYDINVTTTGSGQTVGGSYCDTVTLNSPATEKEVKVPTSVLVNITPGVTATGSSVTDNKNGTYLIKGTVSFSCADGVSIKYSTDGNTPSTSYSSGARIDVDNSTTLRYTVSYSKSFWTKGTVSYSGVIDKDIRLDVVGLEGPAGGTIIYDAGSRVSISFTNSNKKSDGYTYRFIEAAPSDCSGTYEFGGYGKSYDTYQEIGYGRANTVILEGMSDYSKSAAKAAYGYSYGSYADWYLPSLEELRLIMKHASKVGALSGTYWSSTDTWYDNTMANYFKATETSTYAGGKTNTFKVRAVRYF